MSQLLKVLMIMAILTSSMSYSRVSRADSSKSFFTSVVYGTVAGTLVGVATLAFTANPGDNLMNIARGASLGLYAGIILGTYLVYGTDDDNAAGTVNPEGVPPAPTDDGASNKSKDPLHGFAVYPLVQNQSVGIGANLFTLNF